MAMKTSDVMGVTSMGTLIAVGTAFLIAMLGYHAGRESVRNECLRTGVAVVGNVVLQCSERLEKR